VPSHGAAAENTRGAEEEEVELEAAAALIGSQPCDVFIALLGVSPGAGDSWFGF